jgi:hypothetical protein
MFSRLQESSILQAKRLNLKTKSAITNILNEYSSYTCKAILIKRLAAS